MIMVSRAEVVKRLIQACRLDSAAGRSASFLSVLITRFGFEKP
jgi:hypothetical protein